MAHGTPQPHWYSRHVPACHAQAGTLPCTVPMIVMCLRWQNACTENGLSLHELRPSSCFLCMQTGPVMVSRHCFLPFPSPPASSCRYTLTSASPLQPSRPLGSAPWGTKRCCRKTQSQQAGLSSVRHHHLQTAPRTAVAPSPSALAAAAVATGVVAAAAAATTQ